MFKRKGHQFNALDLLYLNTTEAKNKLNTKNWRISRIYFSGYYFKSLGGFLAQLPPQEQQLATEGGRLGSSKYILTLYAIFNCVIASIKLEIQDLVC
jgi:hypothetical protein